MGLLEKINSINLENVQKTRFIELLLLVSSLLVAFKPSAKLSIFFILIVLCSILYYIIVQKDIGWHWIEKSLIPWIISFCFSIIISSILVTISIVENPILSIQEAVGYIILYSIFITYVTGLTLIIWSALKKGIYNLSP